MNKDTNETESASQEFETTAQFPVIDIGETSAAPSTPPPAQYDAMATEALTWQPETGEWVDNSAIPTGRAHTMLDTIDEQPAANPDSNLTGKIGMFAIAGCLLLGFGLVIFALLSTPPNGTEDFGEFDVASDEVETDLDNGLELDSDEVAPVNSGGIQVPEPLSPIVTQQTIGNAITTTEVTNLVDDEDDSSTTATTDGSGVTVTTDGTTDTTEDITETTEDTTVVTEDTTVVTEDTTVVTEDTTVVTEDTTETTEDTTEPPTDPVDPGGLLP